MKREDSLQLRSVFWAGERRDSEESEIYERVGHRPGSDAVVRVQGVLCSGLRGAGLRRLVKGTHGRQDTEQQQTFTECQGDWAKENDL